MGDNAGSIVSTVMEALENNSSLCSLRLYLSDGNADDAIRALERGLPKLRGLRELRLEHRPNEAQVVSIMQMLKCNSSLHKFSCIGFDIMFSRDKKAKMRFYFERNQQLPLLLECPDKVPLSAWPKIFEIAQQCEYGTTSIFRGLLGLGVAVGGQTATQSRKRLRSDSEEAPDKPYPKRQRKD